MVTVDACIRYSSVFRSFLLRRPGAAAIPWSRIIVRLGLSGGDYIAPVWCRGDAVVPNIIPLMYIWWRPTAQGFYSATLLMP